MKLKPLKNESRKYVGLIFMVALVACGGSGEQESNSAEGREIVDVLTANGQNEGLTPSLARCWAIKIVDAVGIDDLTEVGTTSESVLEALDNLNPTPSQADLLIDGLIDCPDFTGFMANNIVEDASSDGITISDSEAICFASSFGGSEVFKDNLKANILGIEADDGGGDMRRETIRIFDMCGIDFTNFADYQGS